MDKSENRAVAVVGLGAVLPDAPDVASFWANVKSGRYSISEVPPERWDVRAYFDPDPKATDKTYSRIGGWVRDFRFNPGRWRLPLPPKVVEAMDPAQLWAVACTHAALESYGYPARAINRERTAVILGNAMAGEKHYDTHSRIALPEYERELRASQALQRLDAPAQEALLEELKARVSRRFPEITEDTMPGELANVMAGRIANLFDLHGPNYVCDAACASALAAMDAAIEGLVEEEFDLAITGGIDRNMGAATFVKFCKIGALSATGTRPYADGADGFVMGEGGAVFLLKRLADAERDGDRVLAVVRGIGGSSDGKGKGITAPNPDGQRFAIRRAWESAGLEPATAGLIEGHGTSTRVGDVVEVEALSGVLAESGARPGSIALGSVKSNIGHLKAAAGAAGMLKTVLALSEKVLPPSINCARPNPNIDFARSPLFVSTELRPWVVPEGAVRRAGVSAFGFGGTNFHVVVEEHVPGRLDMKRKVSVPAALEVEARPLHGVAGLSARDEAALAQETGALLARVKRGELPPVPAAALGDGARLVVEYTSAGELADKLERALKAWEAPAGSLRALRARGVFRGRGAPGKVAFLYTGQGSQYVNMLRELADEEPVVRETVAEADEVMRPLLGRPLSAFLFADKADPQKLAEAEEHLRQTQITQPAVLTVDIALTRLLAAHGFTPDLVMGHSLGEYAALVAAGVMPFADALEAVSARGREMTKVSVEDNGKMAAVFAPLPEIERVLATVDGYLVVANKNCDSQAVIGGASAAVDRAVAAFEALGVRATPLPVSHAFHTAIVAPASAPLVKMLERLHISAPKIPVVANVTGELYPKERAVIVELLGRQVASPVEFVHGLKTLYREGARLFVEVGPKKALQGFVDDVFDKDATVASLFTNHPKTSDTVAVRQAIAGLYAAGFGPRRRAKRSETPAATAPTPPAATPPAPTPPAVASPPAAPRPVLSGGTGMAPAPAPELGAGGYQELGRIFADAMSRAGRSLGAAPAAATEVVISGAGLGLPGLPRIFDDRNVERALHGEQLIDVIPTRIRQAMVDKHIVRLVKAEEGGARFDAISGVADVVKLAARPGALDLEREFGVQAERVLALDPVTQLAIGAGIEALCDAGIPLVMHTRTTSRGTHLPDRYMLPRALRDGTGVIFASAFPGLDSFAEYLAGYHGDRARRRQLAELERLHARLVGHADAGALTEIERLAQEIRDEVERAPFNFDRRFLFRVLSMGHSQLAELIGARGPNTQINAACASTTQGVALAEDWIKSGRCQRVVLVSADDVTSEQMLEWIGAGFLASGAAATDEDVTQAALPFDRRRHGMILGMGAAALVLESRESARARGVRPICEVLAAEVANSAFHGTRLDDPHITQVMERLVQRAEQRFGLRRAELAQETVFVSHETYTPARGGSASAEVHALRSVFGPAAARIVMANTKGFTGHAMGAGIEDVVAVKALETGLVPPVVNFKEADPELGELNLSRGGAYPVRYALRLAAGFGSQIALTLLRWVPTPDGRRPSPAALGYRSRLEDKAAWERFLAEASGEAAPEVEIKRRTLRVKSALDRGVEAGGEAPRAPRPAAPAATVAPPLTVALDLAPAGAEPIGRVAAPPTAPPAAPPPAEASAAGIPGAGGADPVLARVMALVTERTGYAPDMLDPELDLEADLGIDTVKQAELFATVRKEWDIPKQENLRLRDFNTLTKVASFVRQHRPDLEASAAPAPAAPPASPAVPGGADAVLARVMALVTERTGYAADMLDPELDLEADLGIDTVKQAELFATVRKEWSIPKDENLKLRDFNTLARVAQFVRQRRPDLAASGVPPAPFPAAAPAPAPVAAPAPDPVLASAPAAVSPPAPAADRVLARIMELVTEKTGYAADMLDPELDLEADLGIDTVKQAELFVTIRKEWEIPRDETLKLRDYNTLSRVASFVYAKRPELRGPDGAGQVPPAAPPPAPSDGAAQGPPVAGALPGRGDSARPTPAALEAAERAPRRVPAVVLRPPLDATAPTGVELQEGSRVLLMADQGGVAPALARALAARGVEVLAVQDRPPAEELDRRLAAWRGAGDIHGVYWLAALDDEGDLAELGAEAFREAARVRVKLLFATMRALYSQAGGKGAFLVAATRLGGRHGYGDQPASAPLGGAVTGFTKAYHRERPEVLVKAVDFSRAAGPEVVAAALIEETLRDPGAVEIGRDGEERCSVTLVERPGGEPRRTLDADTVFLLTGAAGSIVSAITEDLAAASGGRFYLTDLVPPPDEASADLARLEVDRDGLRRELFERAKGRGDKPTPARIEKELAQLERAACLVKAMRAIRAAGGSVRYLPADLRQAAEVERVVAAVGSEAGRIDVLIHAAGLEISRLLPDKEPAEFALVFDVKAEGWANLARAARSLPLGQVVCFTSIAGRFGNGGQTDYSAANDLLAKMMSALPGQRAGARGVAIDWTAWASIGMAARGSIPKMMELAGIDMLPPEVGVPVVRRELLLGTQGEVLIGGRLGALLEEPHAARVLGSDPVHGPLLGRARAFSLAEGLLVETELDPRGEPFLFDHRIDGTAVLPGVMGVEAFVEAARALFPDWRVAAVEDVRFAAPLKFYRDEPRKLELSVLYAPTPAGVSASCALLSRRQRAVDAEPQLVRHFSGRVRLSREGAGDLADSRPPALPERTVGAEEIYRIYFHGPAFQVLERAGLGRQGVVARIRDELPPATRGQDDQLLAAPRLVEACFQAAGLAEMLASGRMGLPDRVASLRIFRREERPVGQRLYVVVSHDAAGSRFDARVVDGDGRIYVELDGYQTSVMPDALPAELLAPLRAATGAA